MMTHVTARALSCMAVNEGKCIMATDRQRRGHTPPQNMQPAPRINPGDLQRPPVAFQTQLWREHNGYLINTDVAQQIAAWFQSPNDHAGLNFAAFAQASVITDDLADTIASEISYHVGRLQELWTNYGSGKYWYDRRHGGVLFGETTDVIDDLNALYALDAYVRASTVQAWTVGANRPGFLPDSDEPAPMTTDWRAAVNTLAELLQEHADAMWEKAQASGDAGYLALSQQADNLSARCHTQRDAANREYGDDLTYLVAGKATADDMVFWLRRLPEMTYGEFLTERL